MGKLVCPLASVVMATTIKKISAATTMNLPIRLWFNAPPLIE